MSRKTFATTIDETITDNFKMTCKENGQKLNEVLEALMQAYTNKEIEVNVSVETVTNYSVTVKNGK
jgi:hypothetical protein